MIEPAIGGAAAHLPNGVQLSQVRVPFGVVGAIYEARPNVTIDIAALALKSGNAVILKGGREAARTLHFYGEPAVEINDVGVAGLWRLLERVEEMRKMKVVIAVAGMDAALPTVIGGLVSSVVIGVPTSVM